MNINQLLQRAKFKVKANSPEILVVSGVIGIVASTVLACRATLKAKEVVDNANDDLDAIEEFKENGICDENTEYTEEMYKQDVIKIRTTEVFNVGKLYVIPVSLGVLSLACILKSHGILRDRNSSLAAAYMGVDNAFKAYRKRVREKLGEEADHEFRYGIKEHEFEETTVDEKGKEKTVKQKIKVADDLDENDFVKYFTRSNPNWVNNPDHNRAWLEMAERFLNERLNSVGHLTLNEAYEALGFKTSKAGMVYGWIVDRSLPFRSDHISLDVTEVCIPTEDGEFDYAFAIDFNVDGCIYNLMS